MQRLMSSVDIEFPNSTPRYLPTGMRIFDNRSLMSVMAAIRSGSLGSFSKRRYKLNVSVNVDGEWTPFTRVSLLTKDKSDGRWYVSDEVLNLVHQYGVKDAGHYTLLQSV